MKGDKMTEYTLKTAARIIAGETGETVEKIERRIAAALAAGNPDALEIIRLTEENAALAGRMTGGHIAAGFCLACGWLGLLFGLMA
jgi:hypothetical protein